jgi:hypothetical protein
VIINRSKTFIIPVVILFISVVLTSILQYSSGELF